MTRRTVKPYNTRIALPYQEIMGQSDIGPFLFCIDGRQRSMILFLLGYARRQIQWMADETDLPYHYGLPNDEEMETIVDMVESLEGNLMAGLCVDDITEQLAAIAACLCDAQAAITEMNQRLPPMQPYIDEGMITLQQPDDVLGDPDDPADNDEKCELAQATYLWVYQVEMEKLLPWANNLADSLTNMIIATSGFGLVAAFVGVPEVIVADLFAIIIAWKIDGEIANLTNWLTAIKDEWVCAVYNNLPDYDACVDALHELINDAEELGPIDKQMLRAMTSKWHLTMITDDQQTNDTWAIYLEEDFCADCEPGPDAEWTGTPYADCTMTGGYNYGDAHGIDVAVTVSTVGTYNGEVGNYALHVEMSGYNGYGGTVDVYLKQGSYVVDQSQFVVTSSSETQEFNDTLVVDEGHTDNLYLVFDGVGGAVARCLYASLTLQ
jgi:hypothetical protein